MKKNNDIFEFAKDIIPYNRSVVSTEVLKTLKIIQKKIKKLKIIKVRSGSKIFDWKIPHEWKVISAKLIDKKNNEIVDYKKNNLHLVSHSISFNKSLKLDELKKKLYFIKKTPDAIPYRTTYYKKDWGICLSFNQYKKLKNQKYKIQINTKFKKGYLRYGEFFKKGKSKKEILFNTNICHPALANNEISGVVLLTFLSDYLSTLSTNYSYRIVFVPETIGALTFIKKNYNNLKKNVLFGFNCVCVGDEKKYSLLKSKFMDSNSEYLAIKAFKKLKKKFRTYSWLQRGSDERQYSSPLLDLDFSSLMRSKYAEYPEYHTSLDKLGSVVTKKGLKESLKLYQTLINLIEEEKFPEIRYIGEPFLSKRKIYPSLGGSIHPRNVRNILNYLSFCDGKSPTKKIESNCKISPSEGKRILNLIIKLKLVKI
tara:strand:- start:14486 stop:15760 length:1275 start_codon:yes stop_codon:yes gene_type:complete